MFIFFTVLAILLIGGIAALSLASTTLTSRRTPDPPASPADYNLQFEGVAFTNNDKLTLRGWYIPAPESARTIIICSGHNGSMDSDLHNVRWLHEAGFNVLMFDYRGHGRSEGHEVSMGVMEQTDLRAAVEFAKSLDAKRIGVLGFSMGGAVALSTTADCPDIHAVCSDGGFVRMNTVVAHGLRERGVPDGLHRLLGSMLVFMAGLRLGIDLAQVDPIRWIDKIAPRPMLLLHGGQDAVVPLAEVETMFHRAKDPKELWIIPLGEHRNLERLEPERYRRRIIEFFNEAL